ncbi:uncharacterized protein B0J16DRAFT_373096 [Fusarium flagelliforme]|uniref:uncharacterized protein n=1 Tax=Fusarium flagelliforme TaxID=2675880 RepID=UPI001E8ECCE5|nr:uncharacterized protein B0J16DRAFT_373096 [Fusarium flagelliforme]KAH7182470.1 hypothetical protein B0J16DRAFT_373096 [Fusarium flagelliforme]
MSLLSGIGGSCLETEKARSGTRRDSSISLEDDASKRHAPECVKSSLVSFNLRIFEDQGTSTEFGCLPSPSPASSPSVVAPMDVYLRREDSHEYRMMRFSGCIPSQDKQAFEARDISLETSSWELVQDPACGRETLDTPALSPKSTPIRPTKVLESDSDISELALSVDSQPLSDDTDAYKEAVAEYQLASKRSICGGDVASKRPRTCRGARKRPRGEKQKAERGQEEG